MVGGASVTGGPEMKTPVEEKDEEGMEKEKEEEEGWAVTPSVSIPVPQLQYGHLIQRMLQFDISVTDSQL